MRMLGARGYCLTHLSFRPPPFLLEPTSVASLALNKDVGYVQVHGRNYKDWFREKAPVEQRYNYLYRPDELERTGGVYPPQVPFARLTGTSWKISPTRRTSSRKAPHLY
jgi:hypothetical protein